MMLLFSTIDVPVFDVNVLLVIIVLTRKQSANPVYYVTFWLVKIFQHFYNCPFETRHWANTFIQILIFEIRLMEDFVISLQVFVAICAKTSQYRKYQELNLSIKTIYSSIYIPEQNVRPQKARSTVCRHVICKRMKCHLKCVFWG